VAGKHIIDLIGANMAGKHIISIIYEGEMWREKHVIDIISEREYGGNKSA
jgi:hypothetical protein